MANGSVDHKALAHVLDTCMHSIDSMQAGPCIHSSPILFQPHPAHRAGSADKHDGLAQRHHLQDEKRSGVDWLVRMQTPSPGPAARPMILLFSRLPCAPLGLCQHRRGHITPAGRTMSRKKRSDTVSGVGTNTCGGRRGWPRSQRGSTENSASLPLPSCWLHTAAVLPSCAAALKPPPAHLRHRHSAVVLCRLHQVGPAGEKRADKGWQFQHCGATEQASHTAACCTATCGVRTAAEWRRRRWVWASQTLTRAQTCRP